MTGIIEESGLAVMSVDGGEDETQVSRDGRTRKGPEGPTEETEVRVLLPPMVLIRGRPYTTVTAQRPFVPLAGVSVENGRLCVNVVVCACSGVGRGVSRPNHRRHTMCPRFCGSPRSVSVRDLNRDRDPTSRPVSFCRDDKTKILSLKTYKISGCKNVNVRIRFVET